MPAPSTEGVKSTIEYGETLREIFSYHLKDVDKAGQIFRANTRTLDNEGRLSVCGYFWKPSTDTIQMKPLKVTNGRKIRGKISPPPQKKGLEFLFEKLTTIEQMTPDFAAISYF